MKNNQLNRVLDLARHTGDRVVVVDSETDDVLVLMHLADYESLLKQKPESSFGSSSSIYEEDDFSVDFFDETPRVSLKNNFGSHKKTVQPPVRTEVEQRNQFVKESPVFFHQKNNGVKNDEEWWYKEPKSEAHAEEKLDDIPEEEEKFYLEPIDEV